MKLTPPTKAVFWISVVLGLLGLLGTIVGTLPVIGAFAFWFTFAGFALLTISLLAKGL